MPGVWQLVQAGLEEERSESPTSPQPAEPKERVVVRPRLVGESRLLTVKEVMFLQEHFPTRQCSEQWTAVYLSWRDGQSLSALTASIARVANTVTVVRDSEGHLFAMYCGDPWLEPSDLLARGKAPGSGQDANFFGTGDCALAALHPTQKVYRPTGINKNFMYLQTNFPDPAMNGMAMGGIPGLFGVHLADSLATGKFRGSRGVCMTFNNPCLAASEDFAVTAVEVWALGDVPQPSPHQHSVLSGWQARQDRKLLELAGRRFYSSSQTSSESDLEGGLR